MRDGADGGIGRQADAPAPTLTAVPATLITAQPPSDDGEAARQARTMRGIGDHGVASGSWHQRTRMPGAAPGQGSST